MEQKLKSIPVKFAKYEKLNDTVSKVKVYIQYANKNRNGSYMSKDAIEKAIATLYGVPVVGEYKKSKEDFGDHGGKIIIDSDGIEYVQTTVPYGFIPLENEYANVNWEEIEEENGEKREYLVADAYLWKKRYPEVETVFENGANQSMEIDINDYEWSEELDAWNLKDFSYSALCLLGLDVEPAFESASVKAYSLDKDDFKAQFSLMVKEIKESFSQEAEVEEVAQTENEEIENSTEETQTKEFTTDTVDESTNEDISTDESKVEASKEFKKRNFELSYSEVENKIYYMINSYDEDGYMNYEYWICEMYQSYAVIKSYEDGKYYKLPYSVGENDEIMIGEKIEVFSVWLTESEKQSLEDMRSEFEALKQEKEDFIKSQTELQKDEVFEKYDELFVENEEYEKIKESREEYSVESLETTLALLYVKSNVQFSAKEKSKPKLVTLENESKDSKPVVDPYGGLFNKK